MADNHDHDCDGHGDDDDNNDHDYNGDDGKTATRIEDRLQIEANHHDLLFFHGTTSS